MSGMERIYRIDQLLAGRNAVPRAELMEKLGVSLATLKRDLAYMKDRLHAPIVFDRDLGGHRRLLEKLELTRQALGGTVLTYLQALLREQVAARSAA